MRGLRRNHAARSVHLRSFSTVLMRGFSVSPVTIFNSVWIDTPELLATASKACFSFAGGSFLRTRSSRFASDIARIKPQTVCPVNH